MFSHKTDRQTDLNTLRHGTHHSNDHTNTDSLVRFDTLRVVPDLPQAKRIIQRSRQDVLPIRRECCERPETAHRSGRASHLHVRCITKPGRGATSTHVEKQHTSQTTKNSTIKHLSRKIRRNLTNRNASNRCIFSDPALPPRSSFTS